jgi:hypothetical protein
MPPNATPVSAGCRAHPDNATSARRLEILVGEAELCAYGSDSRQKHRN